MLYKSILIDWLAHLIPFCPGSPGHPRPGFEGWTWAENELSDVVFAFLFGDTANLHLEVRASSLVATMGAFVLLGSEEIKDIWATSGNDVSSCLKAAHFNHKPRTRRRDAKNIEEWGLNQIC